jgi:hypothetical protein
MRAVFVTAITSPGRKYAYDYQNELSSGRKQMRRSIALLIVALAMLWCVSSLATWAQSVTLPATSKDTQCRQSVCTTKCDANGKKCLITCDDRETGNNCGKSVHVTPYGSLEVMNQRGSR